MALEGWLGGHDQTGVCWKKRMFEGGLHHRLVEMMVVSRAERAWGCLSGPCAPVCPPPSSELSGRGLIAVDSSSRLASDLCLLWVSGVINTESHLCGKRLLGIRAWGSSKVLCSPGASEGISQRKTHERVSEFPESSHRAGGHERALQRHHGGVGHCWREVGRSLH